MDSFTLTLIGCLILVGLYGPIYAYSWRRRFDLAVAQAVAHKCEACPYAIFAPPTKVEHNVVKEDNLKSVRELWDTDVRNCEAVSEWNVSINSRIEKARVFYPKFGDNPLELPPHFKVFIIKLNMPSRREHLKPVIDLWDVNEVILDTMTARLKNADIFCSSLNEKNEDIPFDKVLFEGSTVTSIRELLISADGNAASSAPPPTPLPLNTTKTAPDSWESSFDNRMEKLGRFFQQV